MLRYNNSQQPYEVIHSFRLLGSGVELYHLLGSEAGYQLYHRVKFLHSRHEQVVTHAQLKSGDFVDESLANLDEQVVEPKKLDAPQKPIATSKKVEIEKPIVAIDPKGDKMVVPTANLEQFCKNNELDVEIVKTVLEGKQKTHKRWKFIYA